MNTLPQTTKDSKQHSAGSPPEPFTTAWFDRLTEVNSMQAKISHMALSRAGTWHCCQVCGDVEDVADYSTVDGLGRPFTGRLCRDCAKIQRFMGAKLQKRAAA